MPPRTAGNEGRAASERRLATRKTQGPLGRAAGKRTAVSDGVICWLYCRPNTGPLVWPPFPWMLASCAQFRRSGTHARVRQRAQERAGQPGAAARRQAAREASLPGLWGDSAAHAAVSHAAARGRGAHVVVVRHGEVIRLRGLVARLREARARSLKTEGKAGASQCLRHPKRKFHAAPRRQGQATRAGLAPRPRGRGKRPPSSVTAD